MDYHFYFPQSGGGGGGTDKTDMQTETLTVTGDMRSVSWKTDRIDSEQIAWQVDAFAVENGQTTPVEVAVNATVSKPTTALNITWETPFVGFINVTTWRKK